MLLRVQKILADAGIASRRHCETFIEAGRVKVNDRLIKLGDKADPQKDKISIDDKLIRIESKKVYFILNKPWGFVTTISEEHGMKTVMELINVPERIFPVGRLDRYSDGLLLLTNDGELAHKLTHPSFGVNKTYLVKLDQPIAIEDLQKLDEGISIDDREVALQKIKVLGQNKLEVVIHEGRKHIVRRMFEELGYQVTKLTRTQFGPLRLGELEVGKWRRLNDKEIEQLKREVKKQISHSLTKSL